MSTNRQLSNRSQLTRLLVVTCDIIMLLVSFFTLEQLVFHLKPLEGLLCWLLAYMVSLLVIVPMAYDRLVKAVNVVGRSLTSALLMSVIFAALLNVLIHVFLSRSQFLFTLLAIGVALVVSRSICRIIIKGMRQKGKDNRTAVMIGSANSLRALYDRMGNDISVGYTFLGYFNDERVAELDDVLKYLGKFSEAKTYLEENNVDMVFCNLEHIGEEETTAFMDYCENNLIHYYSVPALPNYNHRRMNVEYVYEIPIFTIRKEPLTGYANRFMKRSFDIVFSLLFLITCFWWIYIIVAVITKITMPGPVIFRQKRDGLYGKPFWCLKFRSMKVNADADRLQATKDDPRKTRWGSILRKTSLDELPQFINVLKGEMSVVGPRPHMLKHTEEYRKLVDKYMVRHYAKPGITGWAQVTGSRGETSELWMMEERINKDIWYVENWSMLLDIVIIIKTVLNALGYEKGNAY